MKQVTLIHNPTAGDEEHSKENLIKEIEENGFTCHYHSSKDKDWKELEENTDLIAVAGGDGTIRKVAKQLLRKNKDIPVALLALGTANNIAKTFEVDMNVSSQIKAWKQAVTKKVDIGLVKNIPDAEFFLEGMGFGLFPYLMKEMKKREEQFDTPEEELKGALKQLQKILLSYEPRQCHLEIDGTDHSGKFYMVEVMNIRSIGPNVALAPFADPGDGEFDIVLIPEAHKEKFSDYLTHKLADGDDPYQFHTLKGKNITIRWDGTRLHVDDEMIKMEREIEVNIAIKEGALQFLVNQEQNT